MILKTKIKFFLCTVLLAGALVANLISTTFAIKPFQFKLLWRQQCKWEEHQTIKNGKVFCPMTSENPPNLKVVDLYTGKIEHVIQLQHRCGCAPWFAHGKVYLYAFCPLTLKNLSSCVYVISLKTWSIEQIWQIPGNIDVEVCPYDKETDAFYLPRGCYNALTGKRLWKMNSSGRGGILIIEDTAYYHARNELRAYNKKTGSLLWRLPLSFEDNNSYNTPIYDKDNDLIYIGSDINRKSGHVYAINKQKPQIVWKRTFNPGAITSTLTYHRGRLFVPLYNGPKGRSRLALHWKDGSTIWEKSLAIDDGWATSAVDDRYLYTASHGGGMFVVQEQTTGEIIWQLPAEPGICCSPIISGGVVVVGTEADFLAVRVGEGLLVDACWRGNHFYTGYTPEAVIIPEDKMAPFQK